MQRARARTGRLIRGAALAASVGIVAAGCSGGGDEAPEPRAEVELDGSLIASLERYDSCDAFLADVKERALDEVGPYGLGDGLVGYSSRLAMEDSATAAGGDDVGSAVPDAGSSDQVSGTNVQEQGVDEPDIVKTDGSIMVVVDDANLQVLDVSDPSAPAVLSTSPLAGWNAELLLEGDRLVVLQDVGAMGWGPQPRPVDGTIGAPDKRVVAEVDGGADVDAARPGLAADVIGPWWGSDLSTMTQIDLSDPRSPQVERTWTVEGGYTSARLVEGVLRVVVQGNPSSSLPFVQPMSQRAEEAAEAANRAVVEDSTIEDWIPVMTLTDADGDVIDGVDGPLAPCDRLYVPATSTGFGVVGVLTADLAAGGLGDGVGVAVLADGGTVYASPQNLYVATTQWDRGAFRPLVLDDVTSEQEPTAPWTEIHQFELDGVSPAHHVASGTVSGTLLDQWSLSEHDGHLRVAVTHQPAWNGRSPQPESSSSVVVLVRDGDELAEVGRVDGLGLDEQIYAVRFMGEVGYVVTFRQIDPLYVLDLADPTAPAAAGELKITGYSAYLHPVGEGRLLGIGQEATAEGRTTGAQVSLFDVSNPASPERISQFDLGESSSSEVEHDHRAFLWWEGLALVPTTSWAFDGDRGESIRSGLVGIEIGDGEVLAERGTVTHVGEPGGAIGEPAPGTSSSFAPAEPWEWDAQIRRSVVVGDVLLTVSGKGVLASDLATLSPVGWTPLPA